MPPPPRPKKQKREHAQRSQDAVDAEVVDATLSPKAQPAVPSAPPVPAPAPISSLQLSSLSSPAPPPPPSSSSLSAPAARGRSAKLIIVLVKSSLETIQTKKGYELVTADTHKGLLLKLRKDPSEYRPDITHQCLLTLLDSPLNKAGLLQVYVQTEKVSGRPTAARCTRERESPSLMPPPRTLRCVPCRTCSSRSTPACAFHALSSGSQALWVLAHTAALHGSVLPLRSAHLSPLPGRPVLACAVQLLHKLKIRSADSNEYLLRVIKSPVVDHLPPASLKLGTSVRGTLVNLHELAASIGGGRARGEGLAAPIVLCVGSHASGPAEVDWTEKVISVSQYPLSASVALGRLVNAFENAWGVL